MSNRNRTPRTAALFLSLALAGGAVLTTVPAMAADAPVTTVARLSVAKAHAGDTILVKGAKLATKDSEGEWVAKAVKFGDKTVTASDVDALSGSTLLVDVPTTAAGSVNVTVGDALKGPKFTYLATITTDQDDLDDVVPSSESGLAAQTVVGDHITKNTKVFVGGKSVKFDKVTGGPSADGTKFTFDYPAGLTGEQDVIVTDGGETDYLGYVTYSATKPAISAASVSEVLVEAPTAVTLTGSNLDLVVSATFNDTEKVTFAKTTDKTKLTVTIPKGTAVADKDLVVTTKFGETASFTLDRVAAKAPTVTAISGQKAAGGEVTLTGTNLVGLKAVKVYSTTTTVKIYSGSKISVVSPTSAKVTLPILPDNAAYKVEVTTWFATPSAKFDFEVGTVSTPTPAPVLSDATYTFEADAPGGKATIDLEGTNLVVGQKVRYYTTAQGQAGAVQGTVATVGSGGTIGAVELAADLADGTYHVQISKDGGTTWETAVIDFTVAAA
ncbi:IPT/TIG domain-containing protein [Nocardioides caricicola]|uniref:IPT/TIG domain-containing protein n=1 Tax=Nocardioides caricicola TaxID=634770 RepID=A0ABW0N2U9_9ACTN